MGRPETAVERRVAVTKRDGLAVGLVLAALLVTLLVRPEMLARSAFLLAVILGAGLGGMGPGLLAALTIDYFFLPPQHTLRFNPAELPGLLTFLASAVLVRVWSNIRNQTETLLR
jgi:K+-sensing histidine kinase KdpD